MDDKLVAKLRTRTQPVQYDTKAHQSKAHEHAYEQRVKRKVPISRYSATQQQPSPDGTLVGYDWLLLFKCSCGATKAFDLVREAV